ncbi:WASH complex subunit 4-like [Tigriopus californicus]|nr:WASH complex subunit 4-like [Tigriopus californicus]
MDVHRSATHGRMNHSPSHPTQAFQPIHLQLEALRLRHQPPPTLVLDAQPAQTVISLHSTPSELQSWSQLVRSDLAQHRPLSRLILTWATLVAEIESLTVEARQHFYAPLLLYGVAGDLSPEPGDGALSLARILPLLQKVSDFQEHCQRVMLNLFQQLSIFYSTQPEPAGLPPSDNREVHFQVIFDHLGRLLVTLITLDAIIQSHTALQTDWLAYRDLVEGALSDDRARPGLNELEIQLKRLDEKIFGAGLFLACVYQPYDLDGLNIPGNEALFEALIFSLKCSLNDLDRGVGQGQVDFPLHVVEFAAKFVLISTLFRIPEKRLSKRMWDHLKKFPAVVLFDTVMWFPDQFFTSCLPKYAKTVDDKTMQQFPTSRQTSIKTSAQTLTQDMRQFHAKLNSWVIQMETKLKSFSGTPSLDELERKSQLLLQGIQLASTIRGTVSLMLNVHGKLSAPLTKSSVISLCTMLEMLKAIEYVYQRHMLSILDVINHANQHRSVMIITILGKAKRVLLSTSDGGVGVGSDRNRQSQATKSTVLASLVLAEMAISGAPTSERRLITRLCLAMASQNRTFKEEEMRKMSQCMQELQALSLLQRTVQDACSAEFFYSHRVVLPVYFNHVYESRHDSANRLMYMFWILRDCCQPLTQVVHLADSKALQSSFEAEIMTIFENTILKPLCKDLETDLRLQVHSHLKLEDRNPFTSSVSKDLSPLINVAPILFVGKFIDIKAYVEDYLSRIFYNLTTVALHNWRTYGEMRALAAHKFGTVTVDDHLPAQTLEQGLDVLEIMRNIHVFVAKYLYNLNNQIFVEESSHNKHLNTINIRHIANSIRTHGTGIINTTVNFTYQFLRKKFVIFSQFLYDEHIKSRLIKDLRYLKENQAYPFERASKFNKGIRKLGHMPDGLTTYLDQFRMLIAQIGNALGYVRMIRSGGLHFVSNAIRFVPDLEDIPNFEELSKKEEMSSESIEAARILDEVVANLNQNFFDGTQYFQLLVQVFAKQLSEKKHVHLKAFYAILPPLTLNYLEYIMAAKDKLNKMNVKAAIFTDDGFAMGIAYIFQVLDQWSGFDSLHWFQTVRNRYVKQRSQVMEQMNSQNDEKLKQTLSLTLKRLEAYQKEFDLLNFSLSSARIFFRNDEDEVDEADQDNEEEGTETETGLASEGNPGKTTP